MVTITRGRACSSVQAISRGVENVLMATSGAPSLAAANAVIEPLRAIRQQDRHPIAPRHAEREQRAGHVVDVRAQRRIAQAHTAEDDGLGVGSGRAPDRRGGRRACERAGSWLSDR